MWRSYLMAAKGQVQCFKYFSPSICRNCIKLDQPAQRQNECVCSDVLPRRVPLRRKHISHISCSSLTSARLWAKHSLLLQRNKGLYRNCIQGEKRICLVTALPPRNETNTRNFKFPPFWRRDVFMEMTRAGWRTRTHFAAVPDQPIYGFSCLKVTRVFTFGTIRYFTLTCGKCLFVLNVILPW